MSGRKLCQVIALAIYGAVLVATPFVSLNSSGNTGKTTARVKLNTALALSDAEIQKKGQAWCGPNVGGLQTSNPNYVSPPNAVPNCVKGYVSGYKNQGKPSSCDGNCSKGYSQGQADKPAGTKPATGPSSSATATNDSDTCSLAAVGLGWIICPLITLVNDTVAWLYKSFIQSVLDVGPYNTNNPIYPAWKAFRSLADVMFVLVFMVFIFANAISIKLDAYTVKKVIPKLVAAAILVQFSYVLTAAFVDICKILGVGINDMIDSVAVSTGSHPLGGFNGIYDKIGALGAIVGLVFVIPKIAATAAIVPVIGVGIVVLISILTLFFTLSVRNLLLNLLIMISPIAFVAMVLPATEKYFKMWMQNFMRLALMYPMVVGLFAVAHLLSTAAKGGSAFGAQSLIAAAYPTIACFLIPITFRWSGGLMNWSAGYVQNLGNKASSKASGAWKGSRAAENLTKSAHERSFHKLESAVNLPEGGSRKNRLHRGFARTRAFGPGVGQDKEARERRAMEFDLEASQHTADMDNKLRRASLDQQKKQLRIRAVETVNEGKDVNYLHGQIAGATDAVTVQALGGMISKQGAWDQSDIQATTYEKLMDLGQTDEEAKTTISQIRERNFGAILKDSPISSRFDPTQGDKMGFDYDAEGLKTNATIELGVGSASAISGYTGAKLAGQNGQGWKLLSNAKITGDTRDEMLRRARLADDHKDKVILPRDVRTKLQNAQVVEDAETGERIIHNAASLLISEDAKQQILNSPARNAIDDTAKGIMNAQNPTGTPYNWTGQ